LDRMLDEAGFEIDRARISMGSIKAVAHKD
jgi:hypothetical protein